MILKYVLFQNYAFYQYNIISSRNIQIVDLIQIVQPAPKKRNWLLTTVQIPFAGEMLATPGNMTDLILHLNSRRQFFSSVLWHYLIKDASSGTGKLI